MVNLICVMNNKYKKNLDKAIHTLLNNKYYMQDIVINRKDIKALLDYINLYGKHYINKDFEMSYVLEDYQNGSNFMYLSSCNNKTIIFKNLLYNFKNMKDIDVLFINNKHMETIKYYLKKGDC